jgi:hypothetical protein
MSPHIGAGFVEHLDRQHDHRSADIQLRYLVTFSVNQYASSSTKRECNSRPRCGTQGSLRLAGPYGGHARRSTVVGEARVFTQRFLLGNAATCNTYEYRRSGRTTRELTPNGKDGR